ncbi:MAG TPA: DUF5715 family protein [Acidobacteriaceae bacterium]|nr:DUF5715 family protein [Acidobacteriaceae bacterium]
MLNPASRFEENAEAHAALLRPLAILFVIALFLAATVCRPVEAASRERSVRRPGSSAPSHVLMHSYAVSRHGAKARAASSHRASRHEAAETTVSRRASRSTRGARLRSAVADRSETGRRLRRSIALRNAHPLRESVVVRHPEPLARPVPGANSLVEAAADSHPVEEARLSSSADIPTGTSANDMAQAAVQPRVTPMYTRTGRLIVPPPLRGSREILVHQNQMADAAGLARIENNEELDRLRYSHQLIEVAGTSALHVNPELPENRRFARPWTAKFASDIARAYYARFGQPLELNSAVRTISYQLRLQRVNGNAAAIEGDTASPHLTGQAIDFGKKGMTMAEIAWMRLYLEPLMDAGMIDVEEEFQQACFHISVYRKYTGGSTADLAQAQSHTGVSN